MAYRMADHNRWSQLGFIKGYRIELSGEHKIDDMCDDLQGDYPKEFIFTGFHVQCLCHAIAITMDLEEFGKYQQSILDGTEDDFLKGVSIIENVPEGFSNWVAKNQERAAGWANLPYFLSDNIRYAPTMEGLM